MTARLIMPTDGQIRQFHELWENAKNRASRKFVLDKNSMQQLFREGGRFQDDILAALIKHSTPDKRFRFLNYFEITVPKSYVHNTQIATFAEYAKKERFLWSDEICSDEKFAKTTKHLVPGKTYGVKTFAIEPDETINIPTVTMDDCLLFLASQNAILVGVQGILLACQLKKDKFPSGWIIALDKKKALWKNDGSCAYGHPYAYNTLVVERCPLEPCLVEHYLVKQGIVMERHETMNFTLLSSKEHLSSQYRLMSFHELNS